MTVPPFKSYRSTVTPFVPGNWTPMRRVLLDPFTGAPTGIQSLDATGPDGIWTPVDLTAAQIASPTPEMLADLNATYRLNVSPYTRYQSTGTALVATGASNANLGPFTPNGTQAPTTGAWSLGNYFWNSNPIPGSVIGWVCTTAGTPGTWTAWGPIST